MKKQLIFTMTLLPILLFILSSDTFASEGEVYLQNQDGTGAKCKALSVLMPSLQYEILMTCRDLTYPVDINQFNYIAWIEPSDGGDPQRLGSLGVGKVNFNVRESFNRIFVTREGSSSPRTPSTNLVMAGNVTPIDLGTSTQPPQPDIQPTTTPTPSPAIEATSGNFFSRLFQPGRIITFVGVIILLILVFILTRR